ncbi:twin-arginine translocase TatA/TatE family subunit [Conexibacter woesei]|uniref:Sec-independent protein translocase protein TatA n=1 Tax=Conexibacter woesei (strain DSM 14684 / CCUG 47730 / CIP 108061 / JCM 11494 / NBRC 100937 / ID131577) TaxID=469383 RepID=D3F2A0_CONWI|nr:twin-arginine translocase TatA/TatE family subunit [Conexibacter woesei]ADB50275.1 twin-arginine translocation protein, TatA/E family subunit [Conexibacter woesei DSM 14684]
MFSQIGPMEVVLVLVIALIILGPKKLPEAGRSIGKGMREFKDSISGVTKDDDDERELTAVRSDRKSDVA